MQVTVSLVLLAASLFVILSRRYTPQDKHWAYATIGTLLGFLGSRFKIAYNLLGKYPALNTVPQAYFSEAYVFGAPTNLGVLADPKKNIFQSEIQQGQVHAFVNFDFGLHDPEYADLAHMFWQQLGWMKADSYLAENDYLIFVTANAKVFARVYEALCQER